MEAPRQDSTRRAQALGLDTRDGTELIAERILRKEAEALILGRP